MKMKSKLLWLLALVCWLGCAGTKRTVEPPPPPKPPEDPWSWVPDNSSYMGQVSLAELRKTPFWSLWSEVEREQQIRSWVDPAKVQQVTFGGSGKSRADASFVAALAGEFSPSELAELSARDGVAAEPRGLITLYRLPEGVWTQITPKLILFATADRADALVARAGAGPGTAAKETPLYGSLAARVELPQAHLAAIAEDPDGSGRAVLDRQVSRVGLASVSRDSKRLGFGLQVGPEYRLVAVSEGLDEPRAAAMQNELRETIDGYASNFIVRMLGLHGVLRKLQVGGDGPYTYVRGSIPEVELSAALSRVHGALGLAQGFGL